ncbi:MAG: hypothetical protein P8Z81_15890 [Deinococcales bacterium]
MIARLAAGVVLAGLAAGAVLRLALGRRRFPALLAGSLLVPWALHAGFVTVRALVQQAPVWMVAVFLGAGAALAFLAVALGLRLVPRRGLWAALMPLIAGTVYLLGPFLLASLALRRQAIDLDVVPTAVYAGACLFAAALLLSFAPAARGRPVNWPRWRSGRR